METRKRQYEENPKTPQKPKKKPRTLTKQEKEQIDLEALSNQFVFNEEGTVATLDISNYDSTEARYISSIYKSRRDTHKTVNYRSKDQAITLSCSTPLQYEQVSRSKKRPLTSKTVTLSPKEQIQRILSPKKKHFDFTKLAFEWTSEEKNKIKIICDQPANKMRGALRQKLRTSTEYFNVLIIKPDGKETYVYFKDNASEYNNKDIKQCMEQLIASSDTHKQSYNCTFYFENEESTKASLDHGDYATNRHMCQALARKCYSRAEKEKTAYFAYLEFPHSDRESRRFATARIREGYTLPDGITLADCLIDLGVKQAPAPALRAQPEVNLEQQNEAPVTLMDFALPDPVQPVLVQQAQAVTARPVATTQRSNPKMAISFFLNPAEDQNLTLRNRNRFFEANTSTNTTTPMSIDTSVEEDATLLATLKY